MKVEATEVLGKIGCGSERKKRIQDNSKVCGLINQKDVDGWSKCGSENVSSWKCGTDVRGGWLYKPRMQGRYLSWREKKTGEEQRY